MPISLCGHWKAIHISALTSHKWDYLDLWLHFIFCISLNLWFEFFFLCVPQFANALIIIFQNLLVILQSICHFSSVVLIRPNSMDKFWDEIFLAFSTLISSQRKLQYLQKILFDYESNWTFYTFNRPLSGIIHKPFITTYAHNAIAIQWPKNAYMTYFTWQQFLSLSWFAGPHGSRSHVKLMSQRSGAWYMVRPHIFCFSFRWFKKGSCQLLVKVC